MKKHIQILEEIEHAFKEKISNLKNQLEKAKKIEEEISIQLKNQIFRCVKLESELEKSIKKKNEETNEYLKEKCSSSNNVNHQQN